MFGMDGLDECENEGLRIRKFLQSHRKVLRKSKKSRMEFDKFITLLLVTIRQFYGTFTQIH